MYINLIKKSIKRTLNLTLFIFLPLIIVAGCNPPQGPPILTQPFTDPLWSVDTGYPATGIYRLHLNAIQNVDVVSSGRYSEYLYEYTTFHQMQLTGFNNTGQQEASIGNASPDSIFKLLDRDIDGTYVRDRVYRGTQRILRFTRFDNTGTLVWAVDKPNAEHKAVVLPNKGLFIAGPVAASSGIADEFDLSVEHFDSLGNLVASSLIPALTIHGTNKVLDMKYVAASGRVHLVLMHSQRCSQPQSTLTLLTVDLTGTVVRSVNAPLAGDLVVDPNAAGVTCYAKLLLHAQNTQVQPYVMTSAMQVFEPSSPYSARAPGGSVLKFDAAGNLLWATQHSQTYQDFRVDLTGAVLLYEWSNSRYWNFSKLSAAGQSLWSIDANSAIWEPFANERYTKPDQPNGGLQFGNYGSIYFAATKRNAPVKIAKISIEDGSLAWTRTIASPDSVTDVVDEGTLQVDANDMVYFIGNHNFSINNWLYNYDNTHLWSAIYKFDGLGNQIQSGFFAEEIKAAMIDPVGALYLLTRTSPSEGNYSLSKVSL